MDTLRDWAPAIFLALGCNLYQGEPGWKGRRNFAAILLLILAFVWIPLDEQRALRLRIDSLEWRIDHPAQAEQPEAGK